MQQESWTQTDYRKMPLWSHISQIFRQNNHPKSDSPQGHKIRKIVSIRRFLKSKQQVQSCIGFVNYYRNCIPRLSDKLLEFNELLKADKQIRITEELLENYMAINAALVESCGFALKQPITGRRYVLKTEASFRASGYALMIEKMMKKIEFKEKNICTSRIPMKSVLPSTPKNVNLLQRVPGNLPRVPRLYL